MAKKQLYSIEFPVRCSPAILWGFLNSATGLQQWFADKVDEWEGILSFSWGSEAPDKAKVIDEEEEHFIKYHWLHSEKDEYFEFRISRTEISSQTVLIVSDFAEKNDIKDQTQLWHYQVKELFHKLGS
jgi:START-like superfamily domain